MWQSISLSKNFWTCNIFWQCIGIHELLWQTFLQEYFCIFSIIFAFFYEKWLMLYCFLLLSYCLDSLSFLLYQACEYEFPLFCSPSLPVGQFYNYLRNGMMYATPDEKYKLVSLCFWMERKEKKLHNWNKKIKKHFTKIRQMRVTIYNHVLCQKRGTNIYQIDIFLLTKKKFFFPARAPWLKLFDCKFYDLKEIKLKNNHQLGKIIKKVYRYSKFI